MQHTLGFSLRALFAFLVAITAFAVLPSVTRAQPGDDNNETVFDVDFHSPAGGQAGEYPITLTAEFSDGSTVSIARAGNGGGQYRGPGDIVGIWFNGVRYTIPFRICIPWVDGCWCICMKCTWQFPWWPRCRLIGYWDPCC